MTLCIVYPQGAHKAYKIAAQTFAQLADKVAGACAQTVTDEEYMAYGNGGAALTVLIGNDAVNDAVAKFYLERTIKPLGIRYCTDDYCIRTVAVGNTDYLILAGGRPRSAIYAVYRYFERFCGCRWFWDGDRIPQAELVTRGIELAESPRFEYRGLRYFAHRSLHRFQAEHWSFADWAIEIDWILKKRFNLFMLRIGMDDVFQKAFPDIVPYPPTDEKLPGTGVGYNDRTSMWSLEYRGELRKKLLQYAFERDLLHPEDTGTMTHWYSRTPLEYLERKNPAVLPQANNAYADPSGRVWDIRKKEYFADYCKLTEAHVREYGKPEIFHTIGLGERLYSEDQEENKRMKLYVYHKIASQIKEKYPNSPLLIASWDLWMKFSPEEVRELVAELDPAQAIIFDYTSDTVRENNFTNWGVMNKFPWIFGIFSGYEPNSEVRGYYELTNERLKLAKSDPMCRGLVLWPELSHGDPFVFEYLAHNAWDAETLPVSEQVARYCRDRYPAALTERMTALWQDFMPIVQLAAWSIDKDSYYQTGNDVFTLIYKNAKFDRESLDLYEEKLEAAARQKAVAADILRRLARVEAADGLTERDLYDIARTVIGRYLNAAIVRVQYFFLTGKTIEQIEPTMTLAVGLLEALGDLLGSHKDYSLLATLESMRAVAPINPHSEHTLKENAGNHYCRSYITENVRYLYLPEMKLLFEEVRSAINEEREIDKDRLTPALEKIKARYFEIPLKEMQAEACPYAEAVSLAADLIDEMML